MRFNKEKGKRVTEPTTTNTTASLLPSPTLNTITYLPLTRTLLHYTTSLTLNRSIGKGYLLTAKDIRNGCFQVNTILFLRFSLESHQITIHAYRFIHSTPEFLRNLGTLMIRLTYNTIYIHHMFLPCFFYYMVLKSYQYYLSVFLTERPVLGVGFTGCTT